VGVHQRAGNLARCWCRPQRLSTVTEGRRRDLSTVTVRWESFEHLCTVGGGTPEKEARPRCRGTAILGHPGGRKGGRGGGKKEMISPPPTMIYLTFQFLRLVPLARICGWHWHGAEGSVTKGRPWLPKSDWASEKLCSFYNLLKSINSPCCCLNNEGFRQLNGRRLTVGEPFFLDKKWGEDVE